MTKDNPTPITPAGLDDWSSKLDECVSAWKIDPVVRGIGV